MPHRRPNQPKEERKDDDISTLRDEITDLSQVINTKFTMLEMVVKEIREGQDGIVKSISFLDEKFEEMKRVTEKLKIDNQELRNENDNLHKKVNDLGRQMNDLDQYHRRVNLEIVGVPENKEEKTEDIVLAVAQRIDPSVKATDIDIAHRIGSPKSGEGDRRPRQIIVRFTNRRARKAVCGWEEGAEGNDEQGSGI